MSESVIWQLQVKQSDLTDHDWIHHWSKFHAYDAVTHMSLCGKYKQDIDYFESNMPDGLDEKYMCKVCLARLVTAKEETES